MPDLKLAKLPDRKPVRIPIVVSPDLSRALHNYAELYRETYGQSETVSQLIPYMLESFLNADRQFAKALKERSSQDTDNDCVPQRGRATSPKS